VTAAQISFLNQALPSNLSPGDSATTTIQIRVNSASQHRIAISAISSSSAVTLALNQTLITAPAGERDFSIGLTTHVVDGASVGSSATLTLLAQDLDGGSVAAVRQNQDFTVADFTLAVEVLSVDIPATIGPGDTVTGTAQIFAQGPVGTNIQLSMVGSNANVQSFWISPSTLQVHGPQTYQCQIRFTVSPEVFPGDLEGVAVIASTPQDSVYNIGWCTVKAYPTFQIGAGSGGTETYSPGMVETLGVRVNSIGGFGGAVQLGMQGLPTGSSAVFDDPVLIVPAGGTATTKVRIHFDSTFAPQIFQAVVVATTPDQVRHLSISQGNPGQPGFEIRPVTSQFTVGPGQTQKFKVEVRSKKGFHGLVDLSCSGLPQGVSYLYSPAQVQLDANGRAESDLYMQISANFHPVPIQVAFGLMGQVPGASSSAMAILDVTNDPRAEVSATRGWVVSKVGQVATWSVHLRSLNGYQGVIQLASNGYYNGSAYQPVQFSPGSISLNPGQEMDVTCTTLVDDASITHQYRLPVPIRIWAQPDGGADTTINLWPTDNPLSSIEMPSQILFLPRGGSTQFQVPIYSLAGLNEDFDVYPSQGYVNDDGSWGQALGVHRTLATTSIHVQDGSPAMVQGTLTDDGIQPGGTFGFDINIAAKPGEVPGRYEYGYLPFVLVDTNQPDFYCLASVIHVRQAGGGPIQIPLKVGSVSGFAGTVHISLNDSPVPWTIDQQDVTLSTGDQKTVTLTLLVPDLGGFDFDLHYSGEGQGKTHGGKLRLSFD